MTETMDDVIARVPHEQYVKAGSPCDEDCVRCALDRARREEKERDRKIIAELNSYEREFLSRYHHGATDSLALALKLRVSINRIKGEIPFEEKEQVEQLVEAMTHIKIVASGYLTDKDIDEIRGSCDAALAPFTKSEVRKETTNGG